MTASDPEKSGARGEEEKTLADALAVGRAAYCFAPGSPRVILPDVSPAVLKDAVVRMGGAGYELNMDTVRAVRCWLAGGGLWLSGDVGTGKTWFFDCLVRVARDMGRPPVVILGLGEVAHNSLDEIAAFLEGHGSADMVLDDVGREPVFNDYGRRFELLPWILECRRGAFGVTHFTTNMTRAAIAERYGYGCLDRMREMSRQFVLRGQSRRVDGGFSFGARRHV